jgi:hypothetical protein
LPSTLGTISSSAPKSLMVCSFSLAKASDEMALKR